MPKRAHTTMPSLMWQARDSQRLLSQSPSWIQANWVSVLSLGFPRLQYWLDDDARCVRMYMYIVHTYTSDIHIGQKIFLYIYTNLHIYIYTSTYVYIYIYIYCHSIYVLVWHVILSIFYKHFFTCHFIYLLDCFGLLKTFFVCVEKNK